MTNHPRRQHEDDAPASRPDPAPPAPPAFTANGNSAVIGRAVAEALAQTLPQLLMQALANVLQQVPVRTIAPQRACAACLAQRVTWQLAHAAVIGQAQAALAAAQESSPDLAGLDFTAFLPPDLRPGAGEQAIPEIQAAVTMAQGADVCPLHLPGVEQAGKKPFLIASQPLSSGLLAGIMRGQAT